jgi:hypothetical protein
MGNHNYSQGRSFLTGNEENPALVLLNVRNRTSARDGPMFGSMGPSMNTSSLQGMTPENLVASISGELVGLLSPIQALVISSSCLILCSLFILFLIPLPLVFLIFLNCFLLSMQSCESRRQTFSSISGPRFS